MNKITDYESFLFNFPAILADCECWDDEVNYEIAIMMNGTSSEDCEWKERIKKANLDFFSKTSDTLIGDFAFIILYEPVTNITRISLKYLYYMYLSQGYDAVTYYIQKRINEDKTQEGWFHRQEFIYDYEAAKHFYRLTLDHVAYVNKDKIHRNIGDLALVLTNTLIFSGPIDYPIQFSELDAVKFWDIDKDVIIDNALSYSMCSDSPQLYYNSVYYSDGVYCESALLPDFLYSKYHERLQNYNESLREFMTMNPDLRDIFRSLFLSTESTENGAIALFYPGVMEKLATLFNDDYYVFIKVGCEVEIKPKRNCTQQRITAYFDNVKECTGTMEEPLSHYVYYYNASDKKLIVIDTPN